MTLILFFSSPISFLFSSSPETGSSQSAPVQQVFNTIEHFGYHPAPVCTFFVVIGIISGITILGLAVLRHKKALDVSAPLRAAKVLHKATQQDAYIESLQPNYSAPISPTLKTFTHIQENPGTMGLLPHNFNVHLHHPGVVHPVLTYSHQPIPVLPGKAEGFIASNPQKNMSTSYADGRTVTSQPLLPVVAANTISRHPRHLLTMFEFMKMKSPLNPLPDTSICAHSNFSQMFEPRVASWVKQ